MVNSSLSDGSSLHTKQLSEGEAKGETSEMPSSSNDSNYESTADEQTDLHVLTGYPLFMLVAAISLAGFLYSLDVTIIVTVS